MTSNPPIVLFDGICNMCNGAVNFIVDRDARQQFCFASLQSEVGERMLAQHELPNIPLWRRTGTAGLVNLKRAGYPTEADRARFLV